MKKILIILTIIGLALIGLSLNKPKEVVQITPPKTHEENWEETIQDLKETFDLSEEEVTDLQTLIF